jgi:hypothetical protein
VGYEELMSKAEDIRVKAIDEAILDLGGRRNSGSYMQTKRPEIEAMFADVPSQFQPFTQMPDPASFDAPIDELKAALNKLSSGQDTTDPISTNGRIYAANPIMNKMGGAESDVEGWSGTAAQQFRTGYIVPFPSIVHNQFILVAALKSALEAQKAMWQAARENIWTIAENTYKRLEHMDDCGKNEWTMTFTVVASICAVAAVPLTGGASLAVAGLAVTAIGATAQVVAAVDIKEAPKTDITGEAADQVINSMRQAIQKQVDKIVETETRIRDSLSALNDMVFQKQSDPNPDRNVFFTKRPPLADATPGNIRNNMGYTD